MRLGLIAALFLIVGCAETDRYPISGEECGPDDPVLTLDAANCTVPNVG